LDAVQAFQADVLVVGPGLGDSVDGRALVELLQRFGGPVVIDADGLNLLARTPPFNIPNPGRVILTPHPGEMHRLLAGRGRDRPFDSTPEARREAAKTLHEAFGCIIVLKGHGTVVTDGGRLYVNSTGNAGMATAGTGDVLTGLIAALLGQKMAPFDAAVLGVHLHGLAGDLAAAELGQHPLIATDLIDFLPKAFRAHSG
jgi:NAD(P)H-hydrate epimerase